MMTLLPYAMAILGLGVLGLQVLAAQGASIDFVGSRLMLLNLLRTAPRQAEVHARALPGTYYATIGAALTAGAAAQSRDPAQISAASRPAYDGAAMAAGGHWKLIFTKATLGAGLAGGGVVMSSQGKGVPTPVLIMAIVGGLGLAWVWWRREEAERAIVRARAELLPEVDRVFVDGRY